MRGNIAGLMCAQHLARRRLIPTQAMQETAPDLHIQQTRLVIRATRNTLSFAAVDPTVQTNLFFEPYTVRSGISVAANLREAFKTSTLLLRGYKRANLLVDTPVMLVPIDEFQEEDVRQLYHRTMVLPDADTMMHHVLPDLNAVAVFAVNKDLKLVVDDHFVDVRITPLMKGVWTHLHRRSFTGSRRKLYAYFHDKRLEVFSFGKNRFKFSNAFDTNSSRDAMYFILYVWKQMGFDSVQDELHLSGDIPDKDWTKNALLEFVKKTYVANPVADFNRAPITAIEGLPYDLMTIFVRGIKDSNR
jgi:hypothetical protein